MQRIVSWLGVHWKKVLVFSAKLVFIVALFVLLFRPESFGLSADLFKGISLGGLWNDLKSIDPMNAALWFSFAVAIKLCGIFAGIMRWRILLRAQGVHIPFWYLTKCWFWGRAIGLVLPGTLGLDGYRLVESARHTGEPIRCATVIAVEKLTGIIALFSLVFLTLPLGLRLDLPFNPVVLALVLGVLACFIAVSLLLLLQPRVIQIFMATLPVPHRIHDKVNKLGIAATAYSAHRGSLFRALFFALCVHLGTCLMYFGTASAIRAANIDLFDILFASPLLIVGSVFAPTVSGVGVREVVMTTLLGGESGGAQALLFGHLGLWFGEVIPFVLSVPLLLLTGRPNREALQQDIAAVREKVGTGDEAALHLTDEEKARYRGPVLATLTAGTLAGLSAGALIGILEAEWIWRGLSGFAESGIFTWSVVTYALIFAVVGKGVGFGLLFFYLLFDRFAPVWWSYALSFVGTTLIGGLVIGLFRLRRDVYDGHMPDAQGFLQLGLVAGGIAVVGGIVLLLGGRFLGRSVPGKPAVLISGGLLAYGVLLVLGSVLGLYHAPAPPAIPTTASKGATGPNLILVAVDTLRADYLPAYNPAIETKTPQLDAFLKDAIRFDQGFSQASWTKASFGSIFSGMYPECHTAVTKTASLPEDVETVAELLQAGGYYTQGYANNPNITSIFGYDQGFNEYVDMKKSLHFGASPSAATLSMYEVLLKIRELVNKRLKRPIQVTDYYQPASVVKDTVLSWLDGEQAPKDDPFFLFVHFMDPHDPFMDPAAPGGGYGRKRMGNPDPETHLEGMQRAYRGEIEYLDGELGKFFAGLKERGLYDDAMIIVTADHGEEFQEHGGWWHGQTLYEEQTHIPLMIKLPGNALGGEVNGDIARNLDIAPTLLHTAGLEMGAMMQGQALFDDAGNPTNSTIGYSYAENNFESIVLQALRTGSHKLIRANADNPRGLPETSLFNMTADPAEQDNIAGQESEAGIQSQLSEAIDGYLSICEENAIEPAVPAVMDDATREALDALGYVDSME